MWRAVPPNRRGRRTWACCSSTKRRSDSSLACRSMWSGFPKARAATASTRKSSRGRRGGWEDRGVWNFPYAAIGEAVVNAVYHRSYEEREPIEVRISHDELSVLSFPGPDRSIRMEDLKAGRAVSRRYRNRRIGEFLKELEMTEGRSTGIPKI